MAASFRERYSRQILFPEIGETGQRKLADSTVAVVGCGALGSFHAEALARAGVGRLILVDRDYVEWSNLQRQWLYGEADAAEAMPKAAAAARRLAAVNSECRVEAVVADLTPANIEDVLEEAVLVLDGTDNFETRYLVNDYCVRQGVPWVYGGAVGSYGVTMPVLPGVTACFRCMYPDPPEGVQPTCDTAGVLNVVTATVGALQVAAALRILVRGDAPSVLTTLDLWTGTVRQIGLAERDPECPCCGRREFPHLEGARRAPISLCGRNAVQIHERSRPVNLQDLARTLAPLGVVRANEFALRFVVDPYEMTVFPDGRAIIKGTTDTGLARSLYSRYVGA
jgi:adenylyltransferase/sulfurtransferase